MTKWSFFFLLVPIFGVGAFAVAPAFGWWLPENISTFGREIDLLWNVILGITGVAFVGTQLALFYVLFRYSKKTKEGKAVYSHGNQKLEVIWTIVPAVVLLFIALAQLPAWIEIRFPNEKPDVPVTARIVARQFEWRFVYPGPDGEFDTVDDIHVPNELHIVKNYRTLLDLRSMDVLHSFFLPHLRLKYDAVPGLSIPVWFEAEKSTLEFQNDVASLTAKDFPDMGGLIVKLRGATDDLGKQIFQSFSPEAQQILRDYDDANEPNASESETLLKELNLFIEQADLAGLIAQGKFSDISLSDETKRHAALGGLAYPRLLNRQILQDAYPELIASIERNYEVVCAELCGWGHYKMRGRLVVHETMGELQEWLDRAYAEQETAK